MKRLLTEYGLGTSLRRADYTEAAVRGLRAALWSNSINAAEVMGFEKSDMILDVTIGVAKPEAVDVAKIHEVFPYGQARVSVVRGGLDVPRPAGESIGEGRPTVLASVAISVGFEMEAAQ